ncbi:extracellular solute-binding protein [Xylanibacillus composti]|uniref:ABC transporter substrate-binding protein n=1 Tax=Xylanibacillus composti TaxID=1572762 RepID=A0A8J4H649_9BACL|nr:extracellular solute-binding protein [Xylanibacillus composti]MDT9724539.1 extracellular solute-binding protein [Xylanibacillus composti]GIQ70302.1 ABC transporter substrate-binding protein [Xylanibacillus composti]
MRIWKQAMLSFLVILLGAACSDRQGGDQIAAREKENLTLTIWHNWTGQDGKAAAMQALLRKYHAQHPNVELVDVGLLTDNYKTSLRTAAAADELPDLFVMWPGVMTKELELAGLIQPIDSILEFRPDWKDGFLPGALDSFTIDGHIYAVPMNLAPSSFLYYNQAIFDDYEVAVPSTWEELEAAVETFNEHGVIPIALGNTAPWVVQSTIFSTLANRITGTEWFEKAVAQDGAAFTDPIFVKALRFLQDFHAKEPFQDTYYSLNETQMADLFLNGEAAMFFNGGWAVSYLVEHAPKNMLENIHVTIMPPIEGGLGNPKSTSGIVGTGLGVNRKLSGEQLAAALELYYLLAGPEGQQATLDSNTLVSYNLALDESKAHPLFVELYQLVKQLDIHPVYDSRLSGAAAAALNNGLQELLSGAEPEEIALKIQQAHAEAVSMK